MDSSIGDIDFLGISLLGILPIVFGTALVLVINCVSIGDVNPCLPGLSITDFMDSCQTCGSWRIHGTLKDSQMIETFEMENSLLQEYLSTVGSEGVFARWVISQQPRTKSLGALDGSELAGVAILGPSIGLPQASSCWVFTKSIPVFDLIMNRLHEFEVGSVSFPVAFKEAAASFGEVPVDHFYLMQEFPPGARTSIAGVERLSRMRIEDLSVPEQIGQVFGNLDNLSEPCEYYGFVRNHELLALAEASVSDSESASIQQVFTDPSARGRGYARAVVEYVAMDILKSGRSVSYLVSATNMASISIARAIGFELHSNLCCMEL